MFNRIASCTIVETVSINDQAAGRQIHCARDLPPWADPYIAALAAQLEVEHRRNAPIGGQRSAARRQSACAEAHPPVVPWADEESFPQRADRPPSSDVDDHS